MRIPQPGGGGARRGRRWGDSGGAHARRAGQPSARRDAAVRGDAVPRRGRGGRDNEGAPGNVTVSWQTGHRNARAAGHVGHVDAIKAGDEHVGA